MVVDVCEEVWKAKAEKDQQAPRDFCQAYLGLRCSEASERLHLSRTREYEDKWTTQRFKVCTHALAYASMITKAACDKLDSR